MANIFISYASQDVRSAEQLEIWLRRAGHRVWRDKNDLRAGDKWDDEIRNAIGECEVMVALLSKASDRSSACKDEHAWAEVFKKRLVPIRLEPDAPIPFSLVRATWVPFTEQQITSALFKLGLSRQSPSPCEGVPDTLPGVLLGSDLRTLIASYPENEKALTTDLVSLFRGHIESLGAVVRGSSYHLNGVQYRFICEQSDGLRELNLLLWPIPGKRKPRLHSVTVSHIGRIRKISIGWPLDHDYHGILQTLKKKASDAYVDLQVQFESEYAKVRGVLFNNLYDLLKRTLFEHRNTYLRRLAFTVTTAKTSLFLFYFNAEQISFIFEALRRDQQPKISPFEYLISLLTDEPPDSFWNWDLLSNTEFKIMPLDQLQGAETHQKNWVAQNILFDSLSIAVREICRTEDFSLQLNIPGELAAVVNSAVDPIVAALERQFRENSRVFLEHGRAIQEVARPVNVTAASNVKESRRSLLSRFMSAFSSRGEDRSRPNTYFSA